MVAATLPVLGGNYRASRNSDGTWNLYDIPIFGEVAEGEEGNEYPIDARWHTRTLKTHETRHAQGYLPPLHVGHHDPFGRHDPSVERAGYFKLKRRGRAAYLDSAMSTLYGDFLAVPDPVFRRIKRGELPYCSIEVRDYDKHEIRSLALLDREPPYFKFPLITVGKVESPGQFSDRRRASVRVAYLFSDWGGSDMYKEEDKPTEQYQDENPFGGEETPEEEAAEAQAPPAAPPQAQEPPVMPQAAPEPPGAAPMGEDPNTPPPWAAALAQQISSGVAAAIREAMGQGEPQFADGGDPEDVDPDRDPPIVGGEDMEEQSKQFADLRGELAGVKAQLAAREREDRKADMLIGAEEELKAFRLNEDDKADLLMFADRGDTKGMQRYIAAYKRHAVPDDDDDFERIVGSGRTDDAEMRQFSDRGPTALAEARRLKPIYEELTRKGRVKMSFPEFVENSRPLTGEEE